MSLTIADPSSGLRSREPGRTPSAAAMALAAVAVLAPIDLGLPPDGWTRLHLRPLMLVVIAVGLWVIVRQRRNVPGRVGPLELAVAAWLVTVWISTAISDAPLVGAAGAIRFTAFGVLVVATRRAVVTRADALVVLRGLAVGVTGACLVGLLVLGAGHELLGTEHLVGSITRLESHGRLTRPWSQANVAAMAIGASLPALMTLRRPWRPIAASIVIPALLLTYSRGAAIAALAGLVVIVAVRRTRSDARLVVVASFVGLCIVIASPGWAARLDPATPEQRRGAAIGAPRQLVLEPSGVTTTVSVSNLSSRHWRAGGTDPVELSARWVGRDQDWVWGEHRWAVPADLAPGESVEVTVAVDASIPVGTYDVHWDLSRRPGGYLLASLDRSAISRGVVFESAVDPSGVVPVRLAMRRTPLDRAEIWGLAAREFVAAPLVGVGPAELAVASADDVGEDRLLLGRHAHSVLLEPLATTGLLGAVPLWFVLVGGVRLAARRAVRTRDTLPLVALAGLTVALVHGLVDWPLVYSGAAIPIALLTGIAWTWARTTPSEPPAV